MRKVCTSLSEEGMEGRGCRKEVIKEGRSEGGMGEWVREMSKEGEKEERREEKKEGAAGVYQTNER